MAGKFISQWSYSRYAAHQQCPFKIKCKYIDKLPDPTGYAAQRGLVAHAKAESFVQGNIRGMPKELLNFSSEFRSIKNLYANDKNAFLVFTEFDSSVASTNKGWKKSKSGDHRRVWCRGFIDLLVLELYTATVVDYKTGKIYEAHADQGELYAIQSMVHFPQIKIVDVEFWYLDENKTQQWSYKRRDLKKLQKKWEKKIAPLLIDTEFEPTPGYYCKWCNFSRDKNGPCTFNENGY